MVLDDSSSNNINIRNNIRNRSVAFNNNNNNNNNNNFL